MPAATTAWFVTAVNWQPTCYTDTVAHTFLLQSARQKICQDDRHKHDWFALLTHRNCVFISAENKNSTEINILVSTESELKSKLQSFLAENENEIEYTFFLNLSLKCVSRQFPAFSSIQQ